ncbi:MAG: NAD(P)(+) transhydrogenase (Re/Si-specific) subunit beta [Phycisphaerales bacterium]
MLTSTLGTTGDAAWTYPVWITHFQDVAYLIAAVLFVIGLKLLASPRTARRGNLIASFGMLLAIGATLFVEGVLSLVWIGAAAALGAAVGLTLALRIQMTAMPQLVALFNGFGGLASVLVVGSEYARRFDTAESSITFDQGMTMGLSVLIGAVTFTGSLVAFGKLQGLIAGRPRQWSGQLIGNVALLVITLAGSVALGLHPDWWYLVPMAALLAGVLGITLTIAIGGADMPVMVALLNSYSGLAACATGFILDPPNKALIVSGALVGASGIILTSIMCKAMNRSLANVLFGGVGTDDGGGAPGAAPGEDRVVRTTDPEDLAIMLDGCQKVVIVPGYGMAVAQAQHAVRDLFNKLEDRGCRVIFGIHPVAGRMPGHMNVLLAEVDIPYDRLLDLDATNAEIDSAEMAIVLGANDVVNPAARSDRSSPIYGMPIIDVDKAQTVIVCKRSLGAGYAGVQNELFFAPNTLMLFGDAKSTMSSVVQSVE